MIPKKKKLTPSKKYIAYNATAKYNMSGLFNSIKDAQDHCEMFGQTKTKYRIYECTPVLESSTQSRLEWA
jgi:hypothetical protein